MDLLGLELDPRSCTAHGERQRRGPSFSATSMDPGAADTPVIGVTVGAVGLGEDLAVDLRGSTVGGTEWIDSRPFSVLFLIS